jgi:hypothetical protein
MRDHQHLSTIFSPALTGICVLTSSRVYSKGGVYMNGIHTGHNDHVYDHY